MTLAGLGLIGNCQLSALVRRVGAIVWSCMPRFDPSPILSRLLDEKDCGGFSIRPSDDRSGTQQYFPNTNALETRFEGPDGWFRVLDFAPRFTQHERSFRATKLLRIGNGAAAHTQHDVFGELFAEDLVPVSNAMWGNFPQVYLHVGFIHTACAASPRWSEYDS
jgi:GH15 family glucan-1,4-alpha-glucosidase